MHFASSLIAIRSELLFVALLFALTLPAQAIVKCTDRGSIEYTDGVCPNGRTEILRDLRSSDTLNADRADAARRAAADKAELNRLEKSRQFSEQQTDKFRRRQLSGMQLRQQQCQKLLLRKKWLEEDRHEATSRSHRKLSKKSQRLAERYAMECGPDLLPRL